MNCTCTEITIQAAIGKDRYDGRFIFPITVGMGRKNKKKRVSACEQIK